VKEIVLDKFIGKKFNKLTILKIVGRDKKSQIICECKCDCGNQKSFTFAHIKIGHTKSCGCLKKEVMERVRKEQIARTGLLPFGQSAKNTYFLSYKKSSQKRKIAFLLSKKQFEKLITQNCYFCNAKPSLIRKANHISKDYVIVNGIDRLDNSKGYELKNCVSCCSFCNYAKKELSQTEFLDKISEIFHFRCNL
jgi:hypothetical protein